MSAPVWRIVAIASSSRTRCVPSPWSASRAALIALIEAIALRSMHGDGAVSVEQVPSSHPVKHSAELGTRYETVESSAVRVFLASMPAAERDQFLSRTAGSAELYERLSADDDDTALNDGYTMPDEVGISAPVRDHRGKVIATILISAPRYRVDDERAAVLRQAARNAADDLTRRLGGS